MSASPCALYMRGADGRCAKCGVHLLAHANAPAQVDPFAAWRALPSWWRAVSLDALRCARDSMVAADGRAALETAIDALEALAAGRRP